MKAGERDRHHGGCGHAGRCRVAEGVAAGHECPVSVTVLAGWSVTWCPVSGRVTKCPTFLLETGRNCSEGASMTLRIQAGVGKALPEGVPQVLKVPHLVLLCCWVSKSLFLRAFSGCKAGLYVSPHMNLTVCIFRKFLGDRRFSCCFNLQMHPDRELGRSTSDVKVYG